MKKNIVYIAAIAMALFSCSKDRQGQTNTQPDSNETKRPEALSDLDPEKYLVSFGASLEGVETKVEVNLTSGALAFEDGDEALVVCGTETGTYVYQSAGRIFSPKTVADAIALSGNTAAVYYPAGEFSCNTGTVSFTMPASVSAGDVNDLGEKLPLCGIVPATASPAVEFKNLGSVLYVRFNAAAADGETITAVELSGSGVNITGSGVVTWSDTGTPLLAGLSGDGAGTSITVDCSASPRHLTASEYQEFFFFLPQSGSFSDMKLKAIYGKNDGSQSYAPYELVSRSSAMTLGRGKMSKVQKTLSGFFGGGDGSAAYPYVIADKDQFKALSTIGNTTTAGYSHTGSLYYDYNATAKRNYFRSAGANYRQSADFDFDGADLSGFLIGIQGNNGDAASFKGIYDGDGKTISNFSIALPSTDYVGLFPNVGGEIRNLTLKDISVTGQQAVGGIVGWLNGMITDCSVTGTSSVTGTNGTAGIAANIRNTSVVSGCTNYASVNGTGNVGGVVGYMANAGKLERCNNHGSVQGSTRRVGGILGACNDAGGKVLGCQNFGSVTNSGDGNYCDLNGGIVGDAANGIEINASSTPAPAVYSRNEGSVTGKASTGGIIGQLGGGSVACTANTGDVTGTYDVGGIVGVKANGGLWSLVRNQGSVTASYNVGGLVGRQTAGGLCGNVLSNASNKTMNEGAVTAMGKDAGNLSCAGGLIGRMDGGTLGDASAKKTAENTGNVTGTGSGDGVGGLVGYLTAGTVAHCRSHATVTDNRKCVGGAIGYMAGGKVINSYAKGIVKGQGQVGGFVGYVWASADCYILNCAAGASRVVATNKGANDGVGGFVGYMSQSGGNADKKVVIANCVAWDGIVKAPNEDKAASNKIRVGGFVGVQNAQSGGMANSVIHNCYYQGLPSHVGYGGGVDDDTLPATAGPTAADGGVIGVFAGYAAQTVKDCYCDNEGNADNRFCGGGSPSSSTSSNYSRLRTNIIYGKAKISWQLNKVNGTETVAANTYYLDGLLGYVASLVGSTYGSTALCTWDYYTVGDDKYIYPSVLTSMGEDFYKK